MVLKTNTNLGDNKIMAIFTSSLMERILFTIVAIGILLALYGVARIVDTTIKINNNIAQQQHESGENLDVQSTAEGRGMMMADLDRRELIKIRGQMIMFAGVGLSLLGLGWLGYDFRNSRLSKEKNLVLEDATEST